MRAFRLFPFVRSVETRRIYVGCVATVSSVLFAQNRKANKERTCEDKQKDRECVLKALRVAKHTHVVFDGLLSEGCYENRYEGAFAGGINPSIHQTLPGVLIVEGSYDTPVTNIHTPLGSMRVSAVPATCSQGGRKLCMQRLLQSPHFQMRLLCPGFRSEFGYNGPWFLVTHVDGEPVGPLPTSAIGLPPASEIVGAEHPHGCVHSMVLTGQVNRVTQPELYDEYIRPSLDTMCNLLCKPHADRYSWDEAQDEAEIVLKKAFSIGLLNDRLGVCQDLLAPSYDKQQPAEVKKKLQQLSDNPDNYHISNVLFGRRPFTSLLSLVYSNRVNTHVVPVAASDPLDTSRLSLLAAWL